MINKKDTKKRVVTKMTTLSLLVSLDIEISPHPDIPEGR